MENLMPLYLSLKVGCISTLLSLILAVPAAYLVLLMPKKIAGLIDGLLTLPLVLPPTVTGLFLLILFGRNGFLGKLLMGIGIRVIFTVRGAILASFVVSFPLLYRTVRASFEQIPKDYIDAGRTLGMGEFQIFRKIMLPLSVSGIGAGLVLAFARSLGEFGATLMIAGNIPGKTQTISLMIYTASAAGDMDLALKWTAVIILLSLGSIGIMNLIIDRLRIKYEPIR